MALTRSWLRLGPVIGSWEVVSTSGTQTDGTTWETKFAPGRTIKIYSETHFARVATGPDGTFAGATAGRYVLKGTTLTEMVDKAQNADIVGKEWVHEFSITGDLWTSHLVSPVTGAKVKEVWKRVK